MNKRVFNLVIMLVLSSLIQAQTNWCDSTWYEVEFTNTNMGSDCVFEAEITGYITEDLNDYADTVIHSFSALHSFNSVTDYTTVGSSPHSWILNPVLCDDTITICWSAELVSFSNPNTLCNMNGNSLICDDWVFNTSTGEWEKIFSIAGLGQVDLQYFLPDNKIYDLMGRELNEAPSGTFYIKNREKHYKWR
jgi:hypothetical protein